eukprot:g26547.t1
MTKRFWRLLRGSNGVFLLLSAAMLTVATTPYWAFAQGAAATARQPVKAMTPASVTRPIVGSELKLHDALRKATPVTVEDLTSIEAHVEKLVPRLKAATVGVVVSPAQGSGVIVSKDGYVLTAAHVSGVAGKKVTIILKGGKRVEGITLGLNRSIDAGLMKITTKGEYPFIPIGKFADIKTGDWCIATGHPGGYRPGRDPVVRLGRVIYSNKNVIQTDAVLVGGDSGGPLFDMHGRVIGINSRIGRSTTLNYHVPISAFSDDWGRLARSESWGNRPGRRSTPQLSRAILGVFGEDHPKGCKITGASEGNPAAKAGLKSGDIIISFDGKPVKGLNGLVQLVTKKKPGDKAQRLGSDRYKNGRGVRTAFTKIVAETNLSTIAVYANGKRVAFGTVVGADGEVLTKASELKGNISCKLRDGRTVDAKLVGVSKNDDLALLHLQATGLSPIHLEKRADPKVGRWLATPGLNAVPVAVGVLSVPRRRIPGPRPLLGVQIDRNSANGAIITAVTPDSGAAKAGLKAGDVITWIAGVIVKNHASLSSAIRKHQPGDTLQLRIRRKQAEIKVRATLGAFLSNPNSRGAIQNRMGGSLSNRRTGFPIALQHDTYLRPEECGGPIVDLKGNVVGINIARAGRTESYAIPIDRVIALLPELKSGKLAPPKLAVTQPPAPPLPGKTKK